MNLGTQQWSADDASDASFLSTVNKVATGVPAGFNECLTPFDCCTCDNNTLTANYYPLQPNLAETQQRRTPESSISSRVLGSRTFFLALRQQPWYGERFALVAELNLPDVLRILRLVVPIQRMTRRPALS